MKLVLGILEAFTDLMSACAREAVSLCWPVWLVCEACVVGTALIWPALISVANALCWLARKASVVSAPGVRCEASAGRKMTDASDQDAQKSQPLFGPGSQSGEGKGELTAVCRKPGLRTARHPSQEKDGGEGKGKATYLTPGEHLSYGGPRCPLTFMQY